MTSLLPEQPIAGDPSLLLQPASTRQGTGSCTFFPDYNTSNCGLVNEILLCQVFTETHSAQLFCLGRKNPFFSVSFCGSKVSERRSENEGTMHVLLMFWGCQLSTVFLTFLSPAGEAAKTWGMHLRRSIVS